MSIISILVIIVLIILVVVWYVHKQVSYQKWLKTDDGKLHIAMEDLQRNPKNIEALYIVANLFFKKSSYEQAFDHYSRFIIFTSPKMPNYISTEDRFKIYLEFGLSAFQVKKSEDALISLQKARSIMPETSNLKLSVTLGQLLYKKNHLAEALRELEAAHQLDRGYEPNNFYLGMCYARLSMFREAVPLLKKLKSKHHKNPQFMLALSNALGGSGELEEAVKCYKSICENPVVGAQACQNLAQLYLRKNNTTEALEYLKRIPKLEERIGELTYCALYESAKIYVKLGKLYEACLPLQQLCKLNPGYRDAMALLHNYSEMSRNYNLYFLYYGELEKRKQIVRQLLNQLISGLRHIESESYNDHSIEVVATSMNGLQERIYYIWINLLNQTIQQDQVRDVINRGKQLGCSSSLLISTDMFDVKAKKFSEVRPVELVEGIEMRERLLKIS